MSGHIGSTSSGLYSITYLYISNHFIDLINRDLIVIAFVHCVKKSRELSAVCLDAIIGENKYWWEDAIGGLHETAVNKQTQIQKYKYTNVYICEYKYWWEDAIGGHHD